MVRIKVDQSHCNYYLARWLSHRGWQILFTNAGRVSRGGAGTQGECLRIFEEGGLPIPDIVAALGERLLIIEIDSAFDKARPSLNTYRSQESLLVQSANNNLSMSQQLTSLATAFCRTGITKNIEGFISAAQTMGEEIDLWVAFERPRTPIGYWAKIGRVEK